MLHARPLRVLSLLLTALAVLSIQSIQPASAQVPKAGDYYEDAIDIGFKIKMPKDWEFTPPQPGEDQLIGKYSPTTNKYIHLAPEVVLWLEVNLVKFDRRGKEDEAGEGGMAGAPSADSAKDLEKWIKNHMPGNSFKLEEEKDRKINKVEATEYLYVGQTRNVDYNVYAVLYRVRPDVDVAVVFNGPNDAKKWRKFDSVYSKMAKSFKPLEIEEVEYSGARAGDSSVRTAKRRALEEECIKNPGWNLYETDNYFVITDNDDKQFINELKDRLEAIREVYEELYPWEAADRLRAVAAENRKKREAEEDKEDLTPEERAERELERELRKQARTTSNVSPQELSRCSVVRIFKNKNQYHEYGGPPSSAGYWAAFHEELVIYDDKAGGGRTDTWAVLNHEAFHQYIFYLYGSISPHSWYNEGTGDFFSGYEYKHKRFKLKPFNWRVQTIKTALKEDKPDKRTYVPLKELVRYTQREYYGQNDYKLHGGFNYAQGWSFIYFLRTGKGNTSCWNDDWDGILDTYFEVLASTEDLKEAVDVAFAGVDWDELETCWKEYILKNV